MWAFNIKTDILSVEFVVLSFDESPSKYTYSYVRNTVLLPNASICLKKLKLLPIHSESQNEYHKFKEYNRFWVAHLYEFRVEFESI